MIGTKQCSYRDKTATENFVDVFFRSFKYSFFIYEMIVLLYFESFSNI